MIYERTVMVLSQIKKFSTVFCFLLSLYSASGQKQTVAYARYGDSILLKMDIYQPEVKSDVPRPLVLFVFGGGFYAGSRMQTIYFPYYHFLVSQGYLVAAIDYRLGLKGIKKAPSLFNRKPLTHAIDMAVEDTYAATNYLIQHAREWNIDTGKIILSGSSAGAITVLQCDYEKRNDFEQAKVLPSRFEYAGVISFAGAIYSKKGRPDYTITPAPTLLFHGNKDNIVPYNKIGLLGTGMYGSRSLAKKRKKENFPYAFYTFEGMGHDVAIFPMLEYQSAIQSFIQDYILDKRPLYTEVFIKDVNRKNHITASLNDLMKRQK
jgi:acetyl esterase/lipase